MENITKEQFEKLVSESKNATELALKLGYKKYYNNKRMSSFAYRKIKTLFDKFDMNYKMFMYYKHNMYDDDIKKNINKVYSIAELLRCLYIKNENGSMHYKIRNRIQKLGLDTSHFRGALWSKNRNQFNDNRIRRQSDTQSKPWYEIFRKKSIVHGKILATRLLKTKKIEYKCAICDLYEWQDKPIRLRIDHIDGDNMNNEESNLRLLCPNCDSQTDTFCRGKNRKINGKTKKEIWWQTLSRQMKEGTFYDELLSENMNMLPGEKHKYKPPIRTISKTCMHCSKTFLCYDVNQKFCSNTCSNRYHAKERANDISIRKVKNRPSVEELQKMVKETSFCAVARQFGVSDNAVRKWIERPVKNK